MFEYNELTKELLAQGFDENHHPDYVRVANGGGRSLRNIYGGFEFVRMYADQFVYATGCGLMVMGRNVIDDMTCGGITHSHENNNPVAVCPFKRIGCKENFAPELAERRSGTEFCFCVYCECHRTDKPYDYSKSVEFEKSKTEHRKREKYEEFSKKRNGQVCIQHMRYNDSTDEWFLNYDPKACTNGCPNHYQYCNILRKSFSGKKGNVFYDIKATWQNIKREGEQIGLFDADQGVRIEKGLQVFKSPVPMEICEAYARIGKKDILWLYEMNHSYEKFWNKTMKYEILNIRAERKETRNLMQDLEDIKNGISVTHASDNDKAKKQTKKDAKLKRKEDERQKLIRKIEKAGTLDGMTESEVRRIYKCLTSEEIQRAKRNHKEKPKQEEARQMSLFDMMNGGE